MMVMVMGRRDIFPGLLHAGLLARGYATELNLT
jgi:hypothetical protein